MTATSAFFERLTDAGQDPRFSKVCGSVRFDIGDEEHLEQWLLDIDHGRMRVTKRWTRHHGDPGVRPGRGSDGAR
ncbi:hypothetical protein NKG94_07440 [Micromonospora sp. M12]